MRFILKTSGAPSLAVIGDWHRQTPILGPTEPPASAIATPEQVPAARISRLLTGPRHFPLAAQILTSVSISEEMTLRKSDSLPAAPRARQSDRVLLAAHGADCGSWQVSPSDRKTYRPRQWPRLSRSTPASMLRFADVRPHRCLFSRLAEPRQCGSSQPEVVSPQCPAEHFVRLVNTAQALNTG